MRRAHALRRKRPRPAVEELPDDVPLPPSEAALTPLPLEALHADDGHRPADDAGRGSWLSRRATATAKAMRLASLRTAGVDAGVADRILQERGAAASASETAEQSDSRFAALRARVAARAAGALPRERVGAVVGMSGRN